ncbi:MAG: hypothetical protein SFU27_00890 [Thermonemataceae bacterium]|nr:hypothetical protein [Thermonemataceae bacterium]
MDGNEANNPVKSAYYGKFISHNTITFVKVIVIVDCGISEKKMIEVSFWRDFFEKEKWKNAVCYIKHTTMSYYHEEQFHEKCSEEMFNNLYDIAIQQF